MGGHACCVARSCFSSYGGVQFQLAGKRDTWEGGAGCAAGAAGGGRPRPAGARASQAVQSRSARRSAVRSRPAGRPATRGQAGRRDGACGRRRHPALPQPRRAPAQGLSRDITLATRCGDAADRAHGVRRSVLRRGPLKPASRARVLGAWAASARLQSGTQPCSSNSRAHLAPRPSLWGVGSPYGRGEALSRELVKAVTSAHIE